MYYWRPQILSADLLQGQISVFCNVVGGCDGQVFAQLGTR